MNNREDKIYYEIPEFNGKNIPVKEVAKLMGKDQQFIRQGIIKGVLPIGTAFKKQLLTIMKKKNPHNMIFISVPNYYGNTQASYIKENKLINISI